MNVPVRPSTTLDEYPAPDEVLGHLEVSPGVFKAIRTSRADLATTLLGTAAMTSALAAAAKKLAYTATTQADLFAHNQFPDGSLAEVHNDPDPNKNGSYRITAGIWTRTGPLPDVAALTARVNDLDLEKVNADFVSNAIAAFGAGVDAKLSSVGQANVAGLVGDNSMTGLSGTAASFAYDVAAKVGGLAPKIDVVKQIFTMIRASSASYFDGNGKVQIAGPNEFPITHDPLTFEALGMHVGPAGQNILTNSGDVANADWVKSAIDVDPAWYPGPLGPASMRKISDSSASLFGTLSQTKTAVAGLTANGYVTLGYVIKNINTTSMQVTPSLAGATAVNAVVNINPATQTIVGTPANCNAKIIFLTDQAFLLLVVIKGNGTANTNIVHRMRIGTDNVGSQTSIYVGKATAFLGMRFLGFADTRAADVFKLPTAQMDWKDKVGTFVAEVIRVPEHTERVSFIGADKGAGNERITMEMHPDGNLLAYVSDGVNVVSLASPNVTDRNGGVAALTWEPGGTVNLIMNGQIVDTKTGVNFPNGLTWYRVGCDLADGSQPNCIFRNAWHQPRALTPAQIVAAGKRVYSSGSGAFSDLELRNWDNRAMALSADIIRNGNPNLQPLLEGINWFSELSQSIEIGTSAIPLLTTVSYDALVIGDTIRNRLDKDWLVPFITPGEENLPFKQAKATVDSVGFDATISNGAPAVITKTGHGMKAGREFTLSTTGTLPPGTNGATTYVVLAAGLATDSFQFSLAQGGAPIATTGSGSGVHTVSIPPQSPAAVANFQANDIIPGENLTLNAIKAMRDHWKRHHNVRDDTLRKFAATSTGKGGSSLADMADTNGYRWRRTKDAGIQIKSRAQALDLLAAHHAIIFGVGESDYLDGLTWLADFLGYGDRIHEEITRPTFLQEIRAAIFMHQTSAKWMSDASLGRLQQAQLDAATTDRAGFQRNIFLYAPTYFVTNKADDHLDANGIIWLAEMLAKVWYRVLVLKEGQQPSKFHEGYYRKDEGAVLGHCYRVPIQFRNSYVGFTPKMFPFYGLALFDSLGQVPLLSVGRPTATSSLIGFKAAREIVGPEGSVILRNGTQTAYGGNSNIFDNDNFQATRKYIKQDAAMAGDPTADVSALDGNYYPLNNPFVLQNLVLKAA